MVHIPKTGRRKRDHGVSLDFRYTPATLVVNFVTRHMKCRYYEYLWKYSNRVRSLSNSNESIGFVGETTPQNYNKSLTKVARRLF